MQAPPPFASARSPFPFLTIGLPYSQQAAAQPSELPSALPGGRSVCHAAERAAVGRRGLPCEDSHQEAIRAATRPSDLPCC